MTAGTSPDRYTAEATNGGVTCKVSATLKSPGTGSSDGSGSFQLVAVNNHLFPTPNTPCPFMWNMCNLARCINSNGEV